jgi:hypothetical protein
VRKALKIAPLNKAPSKDKMLNKILKLATNLLAPLFIIIFNKLIDIKYCLAKFKISIIITLKKPSKDNYLQPKLY